MNTVICMGYGRREKLNEECAEIRNVTRCPSKLTMDEGIQCFQGLQGC